MEAEMQNVTGCHIVLPVFGRYQTRSGPADCLIKEKEGRFKFRIKKKKFMVKERRFEEIIKQMYACEECEYKILYLQHSNFIVDIELLKNENYNRWNAKEAPGD